MQLTGNWSYPTSIRFGAGRIAVALTVDVEANLHRRVTLPAARGAGRARGPAAEVLDALLVGRAAHVDLTDACRVNTDKADVHAAGEAVAVGLALVDAPLAAEPDHEPEPCPTWMLRDGVELPELPDYLAWRDKRSASV